MNNQELYTELENIKRRKDFFSLIDRLISYLKNQNTKVVQEILIGVHDRYKKIEGLAYSNMGLFIEYKCGKLDFHKLHKWLDDYFKQKHVDNDLFY